MSLPKFSPNSDAQALTILDRKHKIVINLGGKGSGKTATHPAWAVERGRFDTGQLHGIFTNTEKQLKNGVLSELFGTLKYKEAADYGCRPPRAWIREWARNDVPIPAVSDYRGIFYTRAGLHALCGTLFNQSYKQYETLEFGSLRLEEIPAIPRIALTTMLSRCRCGDGPNCATLGHRHQVHLFGNPPVGPHPWLFDWLDQFEEGAGLLYHALEVGETCDGCEFVTREGRAIPRVHGPQLNHRQWPLLRRGIGDAILIKSKTSENRVNLNAGYEDSLAMNSDRATAQAWLEGELIREVSAGCYESFSDLNVRDVAYDPTRTLYVCCDINIEPRIAVLAHPLIAGEYPSEWAQPGVEQIGACGEFFHLGGMSDERFAESLVNGYRGAGDAGYPDDTNRGLPSNWAGLANHRGPIILYGDGAGNIKSVHSRNCESSWTIIRQTLNKLGMAGRYSLAIPEGQNPPARARIHSVNAKLKNAAGLPSLTIAPRCRHTVKDCEQAVWNEDGLAEREWRQGPEMLRTHCMAAVGYMIVQRSPYGRELSDSVEMPKLNFQRFREPRMR